MTALEARSEVFWMAFASLSKGERRAVVQRLLQDPEFQEELFDVALFLERQKEPSRPYEEFAAELRSEGRL